ncbi:MAG TPA: hypothetical protein VF541_01090, partial [Longimicrobium sp.]
MDLRDATLRIYESSDPGDALRALGRSLAECAGLRRAVWLGADGVPAATWPEGARVSPALASFAAAAGAPAVRPLAPDFPAD